ncbi:MAG: DUF3450 domain-containing protein [Pseudomonadota bacterium]
MRTDGCSAWRCIRVAVISVALNTGVASVAMADQTVRKAVTVESASTGREAAAQAKHADIDERLRTAWAELDTIERERRQLDTYNAHLDTALAAQAQRQAQLQDELATVAKTRTGLVPLMLAMVSRLKTIAMTGPFHRDARAEAVADVEQLLVAPGKSLAERYRGVLEGYMNELEYARTLETYRTQLEIDGALREVDIVRIGRVALYYVTSDGNRVGYWSADRWEALPAATFGPRMRQAAELAADRKAPTLMTLPLPTPTTSRTSP